MSCDITPPRQLDRKRHDKQILNDHMVRRSFITSGTVGLDDQ